MVMTMNNRIVIVDIDGCLADTKDAERRCTHTGKFDYALFKKLAPDLEVDKDVRRWVDSTSFIKGAEVLILTGRSEGLEDITREWLEKNNVRCDRLIMNNGTPAVEFKRTIIGELLNQGFEIVDAIDDKSPHIETYEDFGICAVHYTKNTDNPDGFK